MKEEWEEETLFFDGDAFFAVLIRAISQAESVDFETYIYEHDELGRQIARALCDAASRGARVRLMIDGVGSASWTEHYLAPLAQAGVEVRIFHPLPWEVTSLKSWISLFRKVNRRNHRKVVIIDGRSAWVGSMNVSAYHVRSLRGPESWRDTGARVTGPPITRLQEGFEQAWRRAWTPGTRRRRRRLHRLRAPENVRQGELVRLNYTRDLRRFAHREFLRRIVDAEHRIWITNPYLVPNKLLIQALSYAASKGVDVRLIVPRKPDILFMRWAASAFYNDLLKSGVRIFEYLPRVLHAKTFLIDDWVSVGSNNLNHRSLIHDLEVDVGLTHPESHRALERQFLMDIAESQEVQIGEWNGLSAPERWAGKLILYFKHFL